MGIVDNLFGMTRSRDAEDDFDDFDDYDDLDEPKRKRGGSIFSSLTGRRSEEEDYDADDDYAAQPRRKSTAPSGTIRTPQQTQRVTRQQFDRAGSMEVRVVKPTSFTEAQEITDILLQGCTVLLNIEGLNPEIAQRIVDFTFGSCYALNGKYEKISEYVHVITPSGVGISGDFHNQAAAGFGSYSGFTPQATSSFADLPFGN